MAELIEEGNKLLKSGNHKEAVEKYNEALKTPELPKDQFIRANNNLGVVYQILKEYQKSLDACDEVLKAEEFNTKARLRRSKIFFLLKDYENSCKEFIKITSKEERVISEKNKILRNLQLKNIFPVDIDSLIRLYSSVLNEILYSKQQLISIEEGEYHNTWKLQDYFDSTTVEKYVPIPKEIFFKGCEDQAKSENHYYQYIHGSMRSYGMMNIIFCSILSKLFHQQKKYLYFRNQKVTHVGLVRGRYVGKSIIYHSVNRNGVVRRDYDDHYWILMKLEEEEEVYYLDFMATIFGCFEKYEETTLPLRIFRESDITRLRIKERYEERKKLQTFLWVEYQEKVISGGHKDEYFNRIRYRYENELKKAGILKKDLF